MGLSGRPRGRPSKRSQLQQSQQNHARPLRAQAQRHANRGDAGQRPPILMLALSQGLGAIKEDVGASLHDKVDVVSFRSDAIQRYAQNHEQIENVTTKLVHTSKIIPPRMFAPETFESVAAMRKQLDKYEEQILELAKPTENVLSGNTALYLKECDELAESQATALLGNSANTLKPKLRNVLEELHQEAKQIHVVCKRKPYSIVVNHKVDEAPANYDPRAVQTHLPPPASTHPFGSQYLQSVPGNEHQISYKVEERPAEIGHMYAGEGRGGADDAISAMIFDGPNDPDAIPHHDFDDLLFSDVHHMQ